MFRLLLLLTMVGFATSCGSRFIDKFFSLPPPPPPPTKPPKTETAETEVVFHSPWNPSQTQKYKENFEGPLTAKLKPYGKVESVDTKNVDGHFALKHTITTTDCEAVRSAVKKYRDDNPHIVLKASTKCS